MGRPLYPQLSGHCNRPFPKDSRVFKRRLTPNLEGSRSQTMSTSKSHKRTIIRHDSYRTTIQGYTVHDCYKTTHCTSIHIYTNHTRVHTDTSKYTRLDKGVPKYSQLYDGICIHRPSKAYTSADNLSIHQSSKGVYKYKQLWHTPIKQRLTPVQATRWYTPTY